MENKNKYSDLSPPELIEHIKIDKIYKTCKEYEIKRIKIEFPIDEEFENITEIESLECLQAKLLQKECEFIGKNRIRLWIKYEVVYKINDEMFTALEVFEKIIFLPDARKKGLKPECQVFLKCLNSYIKDEKTIVLCVGKILIFILYDSVLLLIHSYGFDKEPEEGKQINKEK